MTFADVCQLDSEALNLLIDQVCYPEHEWVHFRVANCQEQLWELSAPDVRGRLWSTVRHLHYTASWEQTMALAWRYRIGVWPLGRDGQAWIVEYPWQEHSLAAQTEEETRSHICRLAVWQAVQGRANQKEAPCL